MSGTTYSRTTGHAILAGTWEYIRRRGDIPEPDLLSPSERYDYDTVSASARTEFIKLAQRELTKPPDFLKFCLAVGTDPLVSYPGEVDASLGKVADGYLSGITLQKASEVFKLSQDDMLIELAKFSGPVVLTRTDPLQKFYRSIGLTAGSTSFDSVTNPLLGKYWGSCPNIYKDEAEWRAATAVMAEWNGDYGYIEIEISKPVVALVGMVGMQKLARQGNSVLPGGSIQFFIPNLTDGDLLQPISSQSLVDVIKPTRFGFF